MATGEKKITLDDLAAMVHKGFSEQAQGLQQFREENRHQHEQMRHEYVPRSEFLEVKADVELLKTKIA